MTLSNEKFYQMIMIPMIAFIAFQVYELNAKNSAMLASLSSHERRITVNEQNIFNHLTRHPEDINLPITVPLVNNPERRKEIRVENRH